MNIWEIVSRLWPFAKPFKGLIIASLFLTLIGAFAAQVNPLVLRYTVDSVERMLREGVGTQESTSLLVYFGGIIGKELVNIAVKYGQSMAGEEF